MRRSILRGIGLVSVAGIVLFVAAAFRVFDVESESDRQAAARWLGSYATMLERPVATNKPAAPGDARKPDASLRGLLDWAERALVDVRAKAGYSCTLVKREWVQGRLVGPQYIEVKVRQQPFSVYLRYLAPRDLRNREVIYVTGRHEGKMLAHGTGTQRRFFGTLSLAPTGHIAMIGNRYPITEIGIQRLLERCIHVGHQELKRGDAKVVLASGAKINGRDCTTVEVRHDLEARDVPYQTAKIYVDKALNMPIRFEAYSWTDDDQTEPVLIEEYTYLNLKFTDHFSDEDFSPENPDYSFSRSSSPRIAAAVRKADEQGLPQTKAAQDFAAASE